MAAYAAPAPGYAMFPGYAAHFPAANLAAAHGGAAPVYAQPNNHLAYGAPPGAYYPQAAGQQPAAPMGPMY